MLNELAPRPSQQDWPPHGLVSLWDMIRIKLQDYVTLGNNIATLKRVLDEQHSLGAMAVVGGKRVDATTAVIAVVGQLRDACQALNLDVAMRTIDATMNSLSSASQIEVLISVVQSELSSRLFLHVPSERSKFWETDSLLSDTARKVFPVATLEIRSAGTAYACGMWNASVFHAMRAAEDALIKISNELGIIRSGAEQWGNIIDQIEAHLKDLTKRPKADPEKKEKLQRLSEAVIDMRLFKDAWRNQMAHNVYSYNDTNAHDILSAVCRVLEAEAARVEHPG